jgi:hypothetical protein
MTLQDRRKVCGPCIELSVVHELDDRAQGQSAVPDSTRQREDAGGVLGAVLRHPSVVAASEDWSGWEARLGEATAAEFESQVQLLMSADRTLTYVDAAGTIASVQPDLYDRYSASVRNHE